MLPCDAVLLFQDFPVLWAAMLGFVVAAISPAVVVPSLLALQEQGYGVQEGIPTMVVAAAPLDDVLCIAGSTQGRYEFYKYIYIINICYLDIYDI